MAKDAYAAQIHIDRNLTPLEFEKDFIAASKLYNQTLVAFQHGGSTFNSKGARVQISPISNSEANGIVQQNLRLWLPVMMTVNRIDLKTSSPESLLIGTNALLAQSKSLLKTSNQLAQQVSKYEQAGIDNANSLRLRLFLLCASGITALLLSAFLRLYENHQRITEYAKNLEISVSEQQGIARELSTAKAGSDLIMQTVNQGLFLIDEKFRIQPQYSKELEKIFQTDELVGRDLLLLLQNLLNERTFNTTRDYLALLFDPKKRERVLRGANPLSDIECNFNNQAQGGFTSKFLTFDFRRIVIGGKITHVFIAVHDCTERVLLEQELRQTEQKRERQFELLLGMLHIEPKAMDDFIKLVSEHLQTMNDSLRAQDFASENSPQIELLRARLENIFSCVHNIKGNAAFLEFEHFRKNAEEFEGKLQDLRYRNTLGSNDFFSIVLFQSELRASLEELMEMRSKFSGKSFVFKRACSEGQERIATQPQPEAHKERSLSSRPSAKLQIHDELIMGLQGLAMATARKLGKQVQIDATGFQMDCLSETKQRAIKDALIQLVRNSIAHGIEDPSTRKELGKQPRGTITLRRMSSKPSEFGFILRDDGAGLDTQHIRSRAIEQGIISAEQAQSYDEASLIGLIFEPGFSTAQQANSEAGRGVGMSIVKERIVDECRGELSVSSEIGSYCEFRFLIPIPEVVCVS